MDCDSSSSAAAASFTGASLNLASCTKASVTMTRSWTLPMKPILTAAASSSPLLQETKGSQIGDRFVSLIAAGLCFVAGTAPRHRMNVTARGFRFDRFESAHFRG
jgi:hypothetical protein